MKNRSLLLIFLIISIAAAFISGCTESRDRQDGKLNEISKEKSQQIAEDYVRNLDSYRIFHLTEPVLLETKTLNCSSCWQFIYRFDLISEKDPSKIDNATIAVTVSEGEVIDSIYTQGSKY